MNTSSYSHLGRRTRAFFTGTALTAGTLLTGCASQSDMNEVVGVVNEHTDFKRLTQAQQGLSDAKFKLMEAKIVDLEGQVASQNRVFKDIIDLMGKLTDTQFEQVQSNAQNTAFRLKLEKAVQTLDNRWRAIDKEYASAKPSSQLGQQSTPHNVTMRWDDILKQRRPVAEPMAK